MASQKDQRVSDFEEVQQTLAQHPRIRITQTEGNPPDCYEIEYSVTGLVKESDGSIRKTSQHLILFTLPFGYPHFPPAAKPLTSIFHPDIDPDSVRISSYWHETPSLAKLILHLEEMICGQVYNLEDPFNQEAADWYAAHADELPCEASVDVAGASETDELDLGLTDLDLEFDEPVQGQDIDLSLALEPAQQIEDITNLGLTETDSDSSELSLELESPPPIEDIAGLSGAEEEQDTQDSFDLELDLAPEVPEPEPPPQDFGPKLKEIRAHVQRKEMEIAARLLAGLPAIPEVEELRKRVKTALAERDELLAELKAFEDDDNFEEAKKVFKKIKTVAVDTSDLAEIGRRLEQSQNMLAAFSLPQQQGEEQAATEEQEAPLKKVKREKKATNESPRKEKQKSAVRAEKTEEFSNVKRQITRTIQWNVPVAPFAAVAAIGIVIIGGILIYTRDTNNLLEAQLAWQEAQRLFRQSDCQGADIKASATDAILDTVLIPLSAKGRIRKEIAELQASEGYQLCKEGKGTYKGEPILLPELKKREQLDKLITVAEQALERGNIGSASEAYEKAWKFAAENELPEEALALKKHTYELRLQDARQGIEVAKKVKGWENVVTYCRQGIEAAKELGDSEIQESISKILAEALFNLELSKYKLKFTKARGQWQQLLEQLKNLQILLKENPDAATPEKKLELEQLMARCQFYQLLYLAGENYSSKGDYETAVSYYEQALTSLQNKQDLFTREEKETVEQIKRTIILIKISDALNKAMVEEESGNFSQPLKHYREIKELLKTPSLVKDESLIPLEEKVDSKISRLSQVLKKQQNKEWLDAHYKKICTGAYPSARPELLSDPRLDFMKMLRGQELYKLSCLEARKYRLELYYLLNPTNGQWTPYSGQVHQE